MLSPRPQQGEEQVARVSCWSIALPLQFLLLGNGRLNAGLTFGCRSPSEIRDVLPGRSVLSRSERRLFLRLQQRPDKIAKVAAQFKVSTSHRPEA